MEERVIGLAARGGRRDGLGLTSIQLVIEDSDEASCELAPTIASPYAFYAIDRESMPENGSFGWRHETGTRLC